MISRCAGICLLNVVGITYQRERSIIRALFYLQTCSFEVPFRYNCSLKYHEASSLIDVFGTRSCGRWCSVARHLSKLKNWVSWDSFLYFLIYLAAIGALKPVVHWNIIFVSFYSKSCRSQRAACFLHLSFLFPYPILRAGIHSQVPNQTKQFLLVCVRMCYNTRFKKKHKIQTKTEHPPVLCSMFVFGGVYEWITSLTFYSALFHWIIFKSFFGRDTSILLYCLCHSPVVHLAPASHPDPTRG